MTSALPVPPRSAVRRSVIRECRILLVDDETANLDLLEALLEADGYTRLVRTTDPRQVPALVAQHGPDLVLLDLHMPHRHGLEVLAELVGTTPPGEYRPVLVLTADITVAARDRALQAGARDFVTKPFDTTEVLLRVENLLDTRVLHVEERQLRRRAEAAEAAARELLADAELATQERERLLAVVAHDLRNPLGAIAMYAEMLSSLQPDVDAERDVTGGRSESEQRVRQYARTALETIHTSAAAMQHLVEDLLDASTLRRGALRIARTATPLATPVLDALRIMRPAAVSAGVSLMLDGAAPAGDATIDGPRCVQLLTNLVSNAITATPAGGRVTVRWARTDDGDALEGWVRDTGRGIPASQLPHLFTAFWRGDRRDREGVGLGLWIARAIAEAHGGDLTVESTAGDGAAFHFVIPFADRSRRRED